MNNISLHSWDKLNSIEDYYSKEFYLTLQEKDIPNTMITAIVHSEDNVCVLIDNLFKDWQAPLIGTKNIGNPKFKQYTLDEFKKLFKPLSYRIRK